MRQFEVRCPTIKELPALAGTAGLLWTQGSLSLNETTAENSSRPRIRMVTPSYNHGQCLEKIIRSIPLLGYPNLEYIVGGGGLKKVDFMEAERFFLELLFEESRCL